MKHLWLVTLLSLSSLSMYAADDSSLAVHDEETPLVQNNPKKHFWKKVFVGALIATAGGTGLAGSAGTIAVSYHDNSTKIGLPYNPALPQNDGSCTYFYGDPCRREIDDNSVDITNKGKCCYGAINQNECEEWCANSGKKKECVIIEKCEGVKEIDPQMGWGIASFTGQLVTYFTLACAALRR